MSATTQWVRPTVMLLGIKLVMVGIAIAAPDSWSAVPKLNLAVGAIAIAFVGSSLALSARDVLVGHLSSACLAIVTGWSAVSSLIVGDHIPWSVAALVTSLLLLLTSLLAAAARRAIERKEFA